MSNSLFHPDFASNQPNKALVGCRCDDGTTGQSTDRLGILLSLACAIHCLCLPFLLAALPWMTSVRFLANPVVHQLAAVACTVIIFRAIWPGLKRGNDATVEILAATGLALLLAAAFVLPAACCDEQCRRPDSSAAVAGMIWSHSLISANAITSWFGPSVMAMVSFIQVWMTPVGGILIATAHGLNLRKR
ncbi:MerC domain-containing protein [Rubripirellula amarantea]|nr:MerC domain-containing protein [Rubripirellula amarantea]